MKILGLLGLFLVLLFHPQSMDVLRFVLGRKKYILAKDKEDNLICCITYDDEGEGFYRIIMEEYLTRQGLEKTLVKFETKTIKNNDGQLKKMLKYKIVMLDKELVLYKDIEKKAQEYVIKGYNGKLPTKLTMNEYSTVSKK